MTSDHDLEAPDSGGPGRLFGSYLLYEKLGQGGFGVVYRARRIGDDETVALKQMRGGAQASPEERREFVAGAETALKLAHPGIVRVREVGEVDDCPFFTTDLVTGLDLATALELGRPSQARAATWLRDVAGAVDHAHARGVLHSDLKPANILLDERGNAFVTDFGSARRLSQQGQCIESGATGLSYYMSPEQASGDARALTQRSDIYSLGVILYETLTGQVPQEHPVFATWLSSLVSEEPVAALPKQQPALNRDLERICLKCLEKEPSRRYASAALLADDLERVLNGWRPRHARADRAASRSLRWVRRHPVWSAAIAALALIAGAVALMALSLRQMEREQQAGVLETNGFIANSQAGALLFQLRDLADRVERCALRPKVVQRLLAGSMSELTPELEACARGFESVTLMSSEGVLVGQWPLPQNRLLGRSFEFRDYFRGAREQAARGLSGAYLGPAYRSEGNGAMQVAFAAPVFDDRGKWLGVVTAAILADSAIGQIRMKDSTAAGRTVALLGPRGRERASPEPPNSSAFAFVVHPRLGHGREVTLREPNRNVLERAFGLAAREQFSLRWGPPLLLSNYRDPLLQPAQQSLAAFAPVGCTGFVVVVETGKEVAAHDARAIAHKLAWRGGLPLGLGLSLVGLGVMVTTRRKRGLELRPRVSGSRSKPRRTTDAVT
jgi:hypothetical protein